MKVLRCGGCQSLFEVPEEQPSGEYVAMEEVRGSVLGVRSNELPLCPPCRQKAQERGQPPAPPAEAAAEKALEEAPQEQPPEEQPQA